jgi:hypothetical protein
MKYKQNSKKKISFGKQVYFVRANRPNLVVWDTVNNFR